jgi:hypothetical protein
MIPMRTSRTQESLDRRSGVRKTAVVRMVMTAIPRMGLPPCLVKNAGEGVLSGQGHALRVKHESPQRQVGKGKQVVEAEEAEHDEQQPDDSAPVKR